VQQALEEERKQVTSLTQELAAARQELETHTAKATAAAAATAAERERHRAVQQALEEERRRVRSLIQELAAARRELEVHTARETEAAAMPLQEVRERRADVPAGELAPTGHEIEATTASVNPPEMGTPQTEPNATPAHPAKDPSAIGGPVLVQAEIGVEARKLLARADLLLRQGDISAARVVLERAVTVGSAEAGYRLAETYDPLVLSSWGALGTRGDPAKARELYARAYADGIAQAKDRVNALQ
jgi:hypothetical protein